VTIDSPGGTTSGGEVLYNGLRKLSVSKPTVAVIDTLGASAAYLAAIGTDHIVAHRTSLVGSIGVLIQIPNVSTLMNTVGVKLEEVKSSPLKAAPNGLEPSSPEALAAMASIVNDTYGWFKGLVKERRGYDDAALQTVSDGRIFTGQQALGLKLIDSTGDEQTALDWLAESRKVNRDLPIRDWTPPGQLGTLGLMHALVPAALEAAGLPGLATLARSTRTPGALDGLVSVWQPAIEN
jgi:protease-4